MLDYVLKDQLIFNPFFIPKNVLKLKFLFTTVQLLEQFKDLPKIVNGLLSNKIETATCRPAYPPPPTS